MLFAARGMTVTQSLGNQPSSCRSRTPVCCQGRWRVNVLPLLWGKPGMRRRADCIMGVALLASAALLLI